MQWKKRKKLNRLAKKHGLQHGHEYSRMLKRKIIRYKNRNGRRYARFSLTPTDIERMNKLVIEGHWRGEISHPSTRIVTKDEADAMELDPNIEITARIAIDKDGHVQIQGFGLTGKPSFDLSALSKDIKPQSEKSHRLSTALFARSYDAAIMPSHNGESIDPMTSVDMTISRNQIDSNKRLILIEGDSIADDLAKRAKREALKKYLKYRGKTILSKRRNSNGEVEKTEEET